MNETFVRHYKSASIKGQAVSEVERLVDEGSKPKAAVEGVAYRTGISERTLYRVLQKTRGIPYGEREAVLARRRVAPIRRKPCHPDAVLRFFELCQQMQHVTNAYTQLLVEAAEKGWGLIPPVHTMRRKYNEQFTLSERWAARRKMKPNGGDRNDV